MTLDDLVGKTVSFYGVDNLYFKLGRTIFKAVEDEEDGYRSSLGSIEVENNETVSLIFFKTPIARVLIEKEDGVFEGFNLRDVKDTSHIWLRVGTDDTDDYYPSFVFDYTPKAPK